MIISPSKPTQHICIYYTEPADKDKAQQLASRLSLPIIQDNRDCELFLCYIKDRLCLLAPTNPSQQQTTVYTEFVREAAGYRRRQTKKESLLKAIGFNKNSPLTVLDVTGGLGKDSFLMATHGCRVDIIERNPIVAALLEDGLLRAQHHPDTLEIAERIQLHQMDSITFLNQADNRNNYDVIYLDPMFPGRTKSALVKKEMQMLQKLIGKEEDTVKLFTAALNVAEKRVVVKRPRTANPLEGPAPSHSITGKTTRFDVYLTAQQK